MQLTIGAEKIIENAGFAIKDTPTGRILRTQTQPQVFFAGDALRVLTLYTLAASMEATIESETYLASNTAAPAVGKLPPEQVFSAVDTILLSKMPYAMAPLIESGALAAFGFPKMCPCLNELAKFPPKQQARWWGVLGFLSADVRTIGPALKMPQKLLKTILLYNTQYRLPPPTDSLALKRRLGGLPAFDYGVMAQSFAVLNPAWRGQALEYAKLVSSGEPYLLRHLAVTAAELNAERVHPRRMDRVLRQLLDAVQRNPALNTYPILVSLAQSMGKMF